jgi:hypothetical protein
MAVFTIAANCQLAAAKLLQAEVKDTSPQRTGT